jgi:aerobic carbon-monoxide dehydrogenase medium subunit
VKPAPFDYHRPESLEEALALMADGDGKVLAGGQSLVPLLSMRLAAPTRLVDINRLPDLEAVQVDADAVRIGALTRHAQLERDERAFDANPLLRRALTSVAHPTIRNRGTTVGSLVHADPAAEMPAVLCLLDGAVDVVSRDRGARTIAAEDLFVGPLESALEADEVAVSATFPNPPARSGAAWLELARRQGDYAMVGVGAVVTLDERGSVRAARVGLISVDATPVVLDVVAAVDPDDWAGLANQVRTSIDPEGDIHATADYRRHLAGVLASRAVAAAWGEARQVWEKESA